MVESPAIQYAPEAYLESAGVVFPPDHRVLTPAIRDAVLEDRFEAAEARQIEGIVRPGDNVLEIGAGVGFLSTLLSRQRRVSSVLAVEANPHLIGYMERLHARNQVRKVRRLNAVLTNVPVEHVTFYIRRDFWMGSLMREPNAFVETVEVPTRNLDALLREEGISLIVCDIEGAETFLFEDADLSGVDRVFLEVHDHLTGLAGVAKVFATFAARGFAYDPRHSERSVILFQRVQSPEVLRPYDGC